MRNITIKAYLRYYYFTFTEIVCDIKMAKHNQLGKQGEDFVAEYLLNKGFTIICRNWKCIEGEIDLIVSNHEFIVFVEVKTRSSNYWGDPEQAITMTKMKRIINAADRYIQDNDIEIEIRFDITAVLVKDNDIEIHYIEDAFVSSLS